MKLTHNLGVKFAAILLLLLCAVMTFFCGLGYILMMDSGNIVLDIHEEEKKGLTVEGLLEKFKTGAGKMLDNDRILLSGEK